MEEDDEISADILQNLPEQICEEIFGNLGGKDILTASLVSSSWYMYIANSKACMKKIKLSFSHKTSYNLSKKVEAKIVDESKSLLINSPRKYENFELLHYEDILDEVREILVSAPQRKWKEVFILRMNFKTAIDCFSFLSIFEPTVEFLKLDKVYMNAPAYNGDPFEFKFSKLRKLEVKYIQTQIFADVLADCCNLIELHITTGDQTVESLTAIHKMFRCNHNLKKLAIITNIFTKYFDQDFSKDIKFQLKAFEARDIYNLDELHKENFKQFIKTQMPSLEILSLGDWMGLDVVKMLFHMPKLKKFHFKGFHNIDEQVEWSEVEFHKLMALETFHIIEFRGRISILRAFLSATPNVKHLLLYSISNDTIGYVSEALPHLETLSTNIFEATDVSNPNLFPKLKQVSTKVFHSDLIIKTSKEKPELSSFEKLVEAKIKELNPEGRKRLPKRGCCEHEHPFVLRK